MESALFLCSPWQLSNRREEPVRLSTLSFPEVCSGWNDFHRWLIHNNNNLFFFVLYFIWFRPKYPRIFLRDQCGAKAKVLRTKFLGSGEDHWWWRPSWSDDPGIVGQGKAVPGASHLHPDPGVFQPGPSTSVQVQHFWSAHGNVWECSTWTR